MLMETPPPMAVSLMRLPSMAPTDPLSPPLRTMVTELSMLSTMLMLPETTTLMSSSTVMTLRMLPSRPTSRLPLMPPSPGLRDPVSRVPSTTSPLTSRSTLVMPTTTPSLVTTAPSRLLAPPLPPPRSPTTEMVPTMLNTMLRSLETTPSPLVLMVMLLTTPPSPSPPSRELMLTTPPSPTPSLSKPRTSVVRTRPMVVTDSRSVLLEMVTLRSNLRLLTMEMVPTLLSMLWKVMLAPTSASTSS
mmetsp:Transcript_38236/g.60524  ORF Transcript_38236/g.60524 Transcript_38236/m.60524 type:complete len:245 (-) Transcript_38236:168-902(-)